MRFELMTSSLPRKRSTPEPRPLAWKANALPTELLPQFLVSESHLLRWISFLSRSFTEVNSLLRTSSALNLTFHILRSFFVGEDGFEPPKV